VFKSYSQLIEVDKTFVKMNSQNVISSLLRLLAISRSTKLLLFVLSEDLLFQLGEITSKKYKSPYLHLKDRLACAFWRYANEIISWRQWLKLSISKGLWRNIQKINSKAGFRTRFIWEPNLVTRLLRLVTSLVGGERKAIAFQFRC